MIERLMRPINKVFNNYLLKKRCVICGKKLRINGRIYVLGDVEIGDNVSINSGYKYNPIGGQERTSFITHGGGSILIGNNVGISNSAIVSMEKIVIEDDVKIGGSCKVYDSDFHSLNYEQRMECPDMHIKTAPVIIKKGAFIGAHSIILKGVIIGEKSVIGAGSVVTKNVPDGELWAGNPAKYIRRIE